MKPHLQCAEQQVPRSNLTKYCACHAERLAYLALITYESSFTVRGATGVTIQPHQILRLSRRKTRILSPHHIWNLIYNARSNRCHHPTSPKYCACHAERLTYLIIITYETSFTLRGATGVTIQPHQILRLPHKMTRMLDRRHIMKPHFQCAEQQVSRSNLTKYCACHEKWHCKISKKISKNRWNVISNAGPIRPWSEHDPTMIREWKRKPQPASQPRLLFDLTTSIFYCKIQRFAPNLTFKPSPSTGRPRKVTLERHQVLRLPRKVTLERHQVLRLPQKVPLELHQVLRLPRKVTLELHQVLRLPRKVTLERHQVLRLPRKVTLERHQVLHLPRKVTLERHQVLHLPRKVTLELHQVLHLPRKVTLELHYSTLLDSTLLYLTLLDSTWLYLTLLDSTWLYLILLDSSWLYSTRLYLTLLYSTWLYLTLLDSTWLYLTLLDSTWLYLILLDSSWLYSTRLYLTLLYSTWLYLTLLDSTWLYLTLLDSTWL